MAFLLPLHGNPVLSVVSVSVCFGQYNLVHLLTWSENALAIKFKEEKAMKKKDKELTNPIPLPQLLKRLR